MKMKNKVNIKRKKEETTFLDIIMFVVIIGMFALIFVDKLPKQKLMNTNKTVITINDHKIKTDEYRYYMMSTIDSFKENLGEDYFDNNESRFNSVKTYVTSYLRQTYTQYDWALENGYKNDEEIKEQAEEEIEEQKNNLGNDKFNELLEKYETDEDLYQEIVCMNIVIDNFMTDIYDQDNSPLAISEDEASELIDKYGIYAFKDIFFWGSEDSNSEDYEEYEKTQKEKCENAYSRLLNGEEFDDLVNELAENVYVVQNYPDGVTVNEETLDDSNVYLILQQLEIGEHSGVVHSDNGYHIIKRVEPNISDAQYLILQAKVEEEFTKKYASTTISYADGYDDITYSDFVKDGE